MRILNLLFIVFLRINNIFSEEINEKSQEQYVKNDVRSSNKNESRFSFDPISRIFTNKERGLSFFLPKSIEPSLDFGELLIIKKHIYTFVLMKIQEKKFQAFL